MYKELLVNFKMFVIGYHIFIFDPHYMYAGNRLFLAQKSLNVIRFSVLGARFELKHKTTVVRCT